MPQPSGPDDAPPGPAAEDDSAAPPRLRFGRGRALSRISIQSKLLVMLLVSSILSTAIVGAIGYQSGRSSLRAAVFDQLTEVRDGQARALKERFADLKSQLAVFTSGTTAIQAVDAFAAGFNQLADANIAPAQMQAIVDHYNAEFIAPTERVTGDKLDISALLPSTNAQRYLQAYYTAPFKTDDAAVNQDDARDGSPWSAANARFNPFFREIVTRFGYEDALLLDPAGNVVYSAFKDVDLGTNIVNGPYSQSNLRQAYDAALASNAVDYVAVTDFEPYQPADNAPTAWMVAPIRAAGRIAGAMALEFPITTINRLMTFDRKWQDVGMGKTGETILAGPDDLMRSDSRLFLENPEEYKRRAVDAGTPPADVDRAIRLGGTTLVQPITTMGTRDAQRGQTGTMVLTDYLGRETLQAYAPLELVGAGLHWSIVAKIDTSEAFEPVTSFTKRLVLSTTVIIFLLCVAAMLFAQVFVRPIRRLEAGVQRVSAGDYEVAVPVQTRDEIGDLTAAFNEMSRSLGIKEQLLTEQKRENDRLLRSLMPDPVVERYRQGEEVIALDHQDVAVIFADIVGLDRIQAQRTSEQSLGIINELLRQIDAAADDLGIERVRTVHNGYLASCGLNVPRLDNVPRIVDFAVEFGHIIERFNAETGSSLGVRAGIDTGSVSSGLVGRASVMYDMWGDAVNLAYQVQNISPQPGIYVTARVYDELRDRDFTAVGTVEVDGADVQIWRLVERQ